MRLKFENKSEIELQRLNYKKFTLYFIKWDLSFKIIITDYKVDL